MTTTTYRLGRPLDAPLRGSDCRARDLAVARNVHGSHRFERAEHCLISNGLVRLRCGAAGYAPTLSIAAWRAGVVSGDVFEDQFHDAYGGSVSAGAWTPLGSIIIDSPSAVAVVTGVRLEEVSGDRISLVLIAPAIGNAMVTLRRGQRMVDVVHGSNSLLRVVASRRLRWYPPPAGVAAANRVQESVPEFAGLYRFVAALSATADAATFAVTAPPSTTAHMGAGVGTSNVGDTPGFLHAQMEHEAGNTARPSLVMA